MLKSPPFRFQRGQQNELSPITTTPTMQNQAIARRTKTLQKLVSRFLSKSPLATQTVRARQQRQFQRAQQNKLVPITTTPTMQNQAIARRKKTPHKPNNATSLVSRCLSQSPLATQNVRARQQRRPFLQLPSDNNQQSARFFSGLRSRFQTSPSDVFLDSSKAALAGKMQSSQSTASKTRKTFRSPPPSTWQTGTPCVLTSKSGDQLSPIFSSLLHYNLNDLEEIGQFT